MRRPIKKPRAVVQPRTPREDERDALNYVLVSFGLDVGRERAAKDTARSRKQARRLVDGPDYAQRYGLELRAAAPTIVATASRVRRELRCVPMSSPGRYEPAWIDIIERWNDYLIDGGFATLPTLCEGCGMPVLLRGKNGVPSRVCGAEKCRDVVKKRRQRKKRK